MPSSERRYPKLSIRGPVTLFVIVLVLISTLTVLWNVVLVGDYQKLKALAEEEPFHWTFIALGSMLFLTIIVLSSILSAQLIAQIRWSQRQSNFISSVSHELNSPLSSIKLFAQTLRKPDLSLEDRLNFVGKILADVDRLHRLIGNILRAAEMDYRGDDLQVVTQTVELGEYLRDFVEGAADLHADVGLQLSLRIDRLHPHGDPGRDVGRNVGRDAGPVDGVRGYPAKRGASSESSHAGPGDTSLGDRVLEDRVLEDRSPEDGGPSDTPWNDGYWVKLDPLMFRQVLDNLLDNAVRYRGEAEPEVEIRLLRVDGQVEVRLRDRGIGIPSEELPHLFERFYRIERKDPQRRRKGTGIGLYVVRSIVHAHGGKVGVRSPGPGKGATLWIRLPFAADAAATGAMPVHDPARSAEVGNAGPVGGGRDGGGIGGGGGGGP